MFQALNHSGLVASFDESLSDISSDITNDTLLIHQDILLGPDGQINISTVSNLPGLFDGSVKEVISDGAPSSGISVAENTKLELETETSSSRPLLVEEVDLETIPDTELRHVIMTCIPNLESDMIEKISDILRSHGGLISLDVLHDSLKNIKIPTQQEPIDKRVLEAIDQINTTLYQSTPPSGPSDYTLSSVNQDDGDQSSRVFGDSSSERTTTATPTTASIIYMERPGDTTERQPDTEGELPEENSGVGNNVSPSATFHDPGHEEFPINSENGNLSQLESPDSRPGSGILPDNLEDDPHQSFSQAPQPVTRPSPVVESKAGSDEGSDQAIQLSDGLAVILEENHVTGLDMRTTTPGPGEGLIGLEPTSEVSQTILSGDSQLGDASSGVSSPVTSREPGDSPQPQQTTSSSFSRKVDQVKEKVIICKIYKLHILEFQTCVCKI